MNMIRFLTRRQTIIGVTALLLALGAVTFLIHVFHASHSYPQELVTADSLCTYSPDRAKAVLKSFHYDKRTDDADIMYYKLVGIKASNNLYEPQKDSTIFDIVDFFDNYRDKDKRCEAYYYLGKYYIEHHDAPQALKCFQTALDLSDSETSISFKSKVYSQSGTIFLYQDMYNDALCMYKKSYECDSLQNDTLNMINSLRDIAQTYKHLEKSNKCINILQQAYKMANEISNQDLINSISLVLASQYISTGKIKESKKLLNESFRTMTEDYYSAAYSILSDIYEKENQTDSTFYYDKKIMSLGTVYAKEKASRRLALYYSKIGNQTKVSYYIKMNKCFSDSIQKISVSESVATVQSLYNYNLKEKEISLLKIKMGEITIAIIFTLFFIICLIFILIYNNEKSKKRYMQLEILNEHLNNMCKSIKSKNNINSQLSEFSISHTTAHNGNIANNKKLYIYNLIQNRLSKKKNITLADWISIEKEIDFIYPQFKEKIYSYYKIGSREYRICILLKLDFSLSDIATIICRSNATITLCRTSMYRKFFKKPGKAKDFDDFIKSI